MVQRIVPINPKRYRRKYWLLCEFGDSWMQGHWSKTEQDVLLHGRNNIRRFFDQLNSDTLVYTLTKWHSVLDSMGASHFVRNEGIAGRSADLMYLNANLRWITIKDIGRWSDLPWAVAITHFYELSELLETLRIPLSHSTGAIGLNVMRSVVSRRYEISTPRRAARVFKAARIEEKPAYDTLINAVDWDIVGAYAWAMTCKPLPTVFDRTDSLMVGAGDGIVLAYIEPRDVNLDFAYSPIPTNYANNQRTVWGTDPVCGFFTYDDVRLADDFGAKIRIVENYPAVEYLSQEDTEGLEWYFRMLRKFAYGKKIINSLWGMMIVNPGGALYQHLSDQDKTKTKLLRIKDSRRYGRITSSYGMGAVVAARIRTKLYRELLSQTAVILCHTDGGIIHDTTASDGFAYDAADVWDSDSFKPRGPIGTDLGEWRYEGRVRRLLMASAQHYTYLDENGDRQFKWAGEDIDFRKEEAEWRALIEETREAGHSSYDAIRAMFRHRPENWADRWIMEQPSQTI